MPPAPTRRGIAVTTGVFAVLSMLSLAALGGRMALTGAPSYRFLAWNLFLAWVPFGLAVLMSSLHRARVSAIPLVVLGVGWLLTLPNAPYIVTDFLHVATVRSLPRWVDAGLVGLFALTGVGLGLASLVLVHRVVAERLGARWGWTFVAAVIPLCALGIYLGRVHRFNSWDALLNPGALVRTLLLDPAGPVSNHLALAITLAMSACLGLGYLVVWAALRARRSGA